MFTMDDAYNPPIVATYADDDGKPLEVTKVGRTNAGGLVLHLRDHDHPLADGFGRIMNADPARLTTKEARA